MKRIITTVMLSLMLSLSVFGGQIYGSLKEDGRSLPAKVKFDVKCKEQVQPGYTDGYGAYSINVVKGRCTFTLYYKSQTLTSVIYSSDNPLRYDFDLVLLPNRVYELRRK